MPYLKTPKLQNLLLALLLVPLLTACPDERVRIAKPPAEYTQTVAYPAIPAGESVCDGAPCLSDRESASLLSSFADALDAANGKLERLADWFAALPE